MSYHLRRFGKYVKQKMLLMFVNTVNSIMREERGKVNSLQSRFYGRSVPGEWRVRSNQK